jgi:hypothetical protein
MAMNSPADLFLYELSGMRDAERRTGELLGEAMGQVRDAELTETRSGGCPSRSRTAGRGRCA